MLCLPKPRLDELPASILQISDAKRILHKSGALCDSVGPNIFVHTGMPDLQREFLSKGLLQKPCSKTRPETHTNQVKSSTVPRHVGSASELKLSVVLRLRAAGTGGLHQHPPSESSHACKSPSVSS